MIQEQLVDYISSQVKLGVSNDAIKAALVGAGWVPQDVDDTFRKINAGSAGVQPAKPASASVDSFSSPSSSGMRSVAKPSEPQMIRVSDLVSSSPAATSASPAQPVSMTAMKTSPKAAAPADMTQVRAAGGAQSYPAEAKGKGMGSAMMIVLTVLVLIFAGAAAYLFFANMSLASKVGTAVSTGGQTADTSLNAQVTSLQAQVTADSASNSTLTSQVASLTADDQDVRANLSLFIAPPGAPATTTVTLSGFITAIKPTYILMTSLGARVYVKNSTAAGVEAALQPFLNTSTTVQLSGTYVPGTAVITVITVNGNPIATVATTSAATSSAQ